MDLQDLNLGVRAFNCLRRAGYTTLEEVAAAPREKIMRVRNIGRRSFEEVERALAEHGMTFADEPEKQMFSHEQLDAPKGFILVHAENGFLFYVNVDSIACFSTLEYDDGHRVTVVTLIYKLTNGERDYLTVTETPSEICTLIDRARR